MNEYEVLCNGSYIKVRAETYSNDSDGNLDMIIFDDEGLEVYVATFKEWSYVVKLAK